MDNGKHNRHGPVIAPELVEACAARHTRLCPRQVLGLRAGLLGGQALGVDVPRADKRLLAIVETDGCFADGVAVATGCAVGRRTLRVVDYGKVAAVFVDVETGEAVRIWPREGVRATARRYAPPDAHSRWHAQLEGYQRMPDDELLAAQRVALAFSLSELLGQPGQRTACEACGEEIINQREVVVGGRVLCRACAGQSYYTLPRAGFAEPHSAALAVLLSSAPGGR